MLWIHLDQDKYRWLALGLMKTNIQVPQKEGNFWVHWVTISFSSALLLGVSYKDHSQAVQLLVFQLPLHILVFGSAESALLHNMHKQRAEQRKRLIYSLLARNVTWRTFWCDWSLTDRQIDSWLPITSTCTFLCSVGPIFLSFSFSLHFSSPGFQTNA